MKALKLEYPVHTLNKRVLLLAGTILSSETMDRLISASKEELYPTVPIFAYGTIHKDLIKLIKHGPYLVIFDDPEIVANILNSMGKVRINLPILESLDYFRNYDFYTYQHILKVFALSSLLAQTLVKNNHALSQETMAGPMHDFGKICVPLEILKKADPLTRIEREILEHHALAGYVLLSYYLKDSKSYFSKVAKEHHERRDGSGYPLGLSLTDPMVELIAVSDIYDALISTRPYRKTAYDNRTALEEITEMAIQGKIGWDVVKALISFNRENKPYFEEVEVGAEKRGTPPQKNLYGVFSNKNS